MPDQTTSWICDRCSRLIVHHTSPDSPVARCQFNKGRGDVGSRVTISDVTIPEFQGPDGLMWLLKLIALQSRPTSELLEIIKRIHIPGYEHARGRCEEVLTTLGIVPNVTPGYWRQDDLQRVLDFLDEE